MELQSRVVEKDLAKQQLPDPENPKGTLSVRRNPQRRARHQKPSRFSPPSATAIADGRFPSFSMANHIEAEPSMHPRTLPKPSEESFENLKVFLRIRPLEVKGKPGGKPYKGDGKPPARGAPAGGVGRSKGGEKDVCCLVVNGSSSVALAAPLSGLRLKREKSEIFDGFSFVFPPESQQKDVYERVLAPLVVDFLQGKSGLLAAMGPTGSGKTHTLFGCPREPGIVNLAFQQIFCHENVTVGPHKFRSYYLSMFEIYSDRGKGERIFDLSAGESELSFQQSTIRGLQEAMISNIAEAESVIAHGMLRRMTAVTNANCQSSRSQCVINIRCEPKLAHEEGGIPNGSVLTILDLAGAEREKKNRKSGYKIVGKQLHQQHIYGFQFMLEIIIRTSKES